MASNHGVKSVVELLIERGGAVDAEDEEGNTPLHDVAHCGDYSSDADFDPEGVIEILLAHGAYIDDVNEDGETALHRAAFFGDTRIVAFLLSKGLDVNVRTYAGDTPLHSACSMKVGPDGERPEYVEVARILLTNGADVNAVNGYDCSPLDLAVFPAKAFGLADFLRQQGGSRYENDDTV